MKPLLLVALAAVAFAQDTDISGWSAAKWGMTAAQVRDAFPSARAVNSERDRGLLVRLESSPERIANYTATAHFAFEPDRDRLTAVSLTLDNSIPRSSAFESLKQSLADKYGRPTTDTATSDHNAFGSRSNTRSVQWRLKSSTVVLTWMDYGDVGMVEVRYAERKPDPTL